MKNPQVTVLMPAYNGEKYIGEAIESILNQTFKDFEFIIIDDASRDNTWKIIKKYAIKDSRIRPYKNKTNLNISRTLNKGIDLAKGNYIARMDNDDISLSDRIASQYSFMEKNIDVGILGGNMEIVDENENKIGFRKYNLTDIEIRKNIFRYSPFSHPLVMYQTDVIKKAGYYNPKYVFANDYEMYFRIGRVSKFANLAKTLIKYRVVHNSMTSGSAFKMEKETLSVRSIYKNNQGYKMSFFDKIYNFIEHVSMYTVPEKIKMKLFNIWRSI